MIAAVQAFLVLVAWWRGSVERRERRNGLQGLGEEDEDDAAEDWEREPLLQQ
jgi:hypothetical protein